jgi:hypothetical protein
LFLLSLNCLAPPPAIEGSGERHIPIMHTNAPAQLSIKENRQHEDSANGKSTK